MTTLAEIEAAADALSAEEKQKLVQFLTARLHSQGVRLPEPRRFTREQIAKWVAKDEAEMREFLEGR